MLVVAAVTPWVYRLRNLATGAEVEAHVQRMERYADASLGVTEALKEHVGYVAGGYEVAAIKEARKTKGGKWELLVKWLGFDDAEATWVTAEVLAEDVPMLLLQFIDSEKEILPSECQQYLRMLVQQGS